MNETTERFFREIAERVGAGHVREVRLFPPLRQGVAETAVAVIATHPDADDDAASSVRHTVYSARYRLLVKGPERGQWEVDIVSQADAPLATIDDVVRGVMHRTGEELEPERIAGKAFRSIVGWMGPEAHADSVVHEPHAAPDDSSGASASDASGEAVAAGAPDGPTYVSSTSKIDANEAPSEEQNAGDSPTKGALSP